MLAGLLDEHCTTPCLFINDSIFTRGITYRKEFVFICLTCNMQSSTRTHSICKNEFRSGRVQTAVQRISCGCPLLAALPQNWIGIVGNEFIFTIMTGSRSKHPKNTSKASSGKLLDFNLLPFSCAGVKTQSSVQALTSLVLRAFSKHRQVRPLHPEEPIADDAPQQSRMLRLLLHLSRAASRESPDSDHRSHVFGSRRPPRRFRLSPWPPARCWQAIPLHRQQRPRASQTTSRHPRQRRSMCSRVPWSTAA